MFPLLTNPLTAIIAASAGGLLLTAIYFLRNRFRRRVVSSLILWRDAREAREGGTKIRRLHTPLLFFLELLALALLCLAAADPQVRMAQGTRPLVIILDDSYSMTAGGDDSPRVRALNALTQELKRNPPYSIRFVLAGDRPQLLGDNVRSQIEAMRITDGWRCRSSMARLDEAISLGAELGGELALVLVLTDHAPAENVVQEKGRLRWWSFGKGQGNLAIVNAARTSRDGLDRCLLEVANLSSRDLRVPLKVESVSGQPLTMKSLEMLAGETKHVTLQPPVGFGPLVASIPDDDLSLDNRVVLQPQHARPVRVDLHVRDRRLREPLEKAIKSARNADFVEKNLDLLFTDRPDRKETDANTWVVHVLNEKDSTAYTGPFVLDRSHMLTDGLGLRGIVWGGGKSALDGTPVVMAGNTALMTDIEQPTPGGGIRHELRLRFNPLLSTLHESPDWPILIDNILAWRGASMPGPSRSNARLGEQVVVNLPGYRDTVDLAGPDGRLQATAVKGRQLSVRADEVGTYKVTIDKTTYAFAVNALSRDESDLRQCATGQWGDWLDDTTVRLEYRSVAWLVLLVVLGLVALHMWLVTRNKT